MGIRPWEWGQLTVAEADSLIIAVDEIAADIEEARRKADAH